MNVHDRMRVCRRGQYACAFVYECGRGEYLCVCAHVDLFSLLRGAVGMETQPKTGEMGSGVSGDTDPVKCVQD